MANVANLAKTRTNARSAAIGECGERVANGGESAATRT